MPILFITCAFIFNAIANILFKFGAKKGVIFSGFSINTITENSLFILGFFFFGLNAVFYFITLNTLPLSVAYPVMVGMSLLIINTFAYLHFGEQITTMQMIGYILLILGMVLIYSFQANK